VRSPPQSPVIHREVEENISSSAWATQLTHPSKKQLLNTILFLLLIVVSWCKVIKA
jgi:hypothetical protein